MGDYPSLLDTAYESLQQKEMLPEKFCHFEVILESLPPTVPVEVTSLFQDINKQIEAYNEQFAILIQELGVLCTRDPRKKPTVELFFSAFLDLFKLAYTVYENEPEKLQQFQRLLEEFVRFLQTTTMNVEDPIQQGLLLQLTKSAWAYTKTQDSMKSLATQLGGNRKLKNRTRKHKRKAH
jgi:hypothetical protein